MPVFWAALYSYSKDMTRVHTASSLYSFQATWTYFSQNEGAYILSNLINNFTKLAKYAMELLRSTKAIVYSHARWSAP